MTCAICGTNDGHTDDTHNEFFVCSACYPIIAPLIDCRLAHLRRLRLAGQTVDAVGTQRTKPPKPGG